MRLCAFADEASVSVRGQIDALKRNGIGLLEIRGVDGENIADITPVKAKEVKKMLDDAGIRVWSMGSPLGKYKMECDFAPHAEKIKRIMELSYIFEAPSIYNGLPFNSFCAVLKGKLRTLDLLSKVEFQLSVNVLCSHSVKGHPQNVTMALLEKVKVLSCHSNMLIRVVFKSVMSCHVLIAEPVCNVKVLRQSRCV